MKIAVLGAAGEVGSRAVNEALARGHEVTAIVRRAGVLSGLPEGVEREVTDVFDATALNKVLTGHDAVISALRPLEGSEYLLPLMTAAVLSAAASSAVRAMIVGGAARLRVPGAEGHTVLTAPGFLPADIVPIARACQAQYERCLDEPSAEWTYASPAAVLQAGERTGRFRMGSDTLVTDDAGVSRISLEDFAVALIDELEAPKYVRNAFTLGY